jgi:hypothetical protein
LRQVVLQHLQPDPGDAARIRDGFSTFIMITSDLPSAVQRGGGSSRTFRRAVNPSRTRTVMSAPPRIAPIAMMLLAIDAHSVRVFVWSAKTQPA